MAEDPRRKDSAVGRGGGSQEVGLAGPRRGGIPRRIEVELHAKGIRRPDVRGVQLRRERARNVQGPRYPAVQSPCPGRGDGDRRLRHGRHGRVQLHPRRVHGRAVPALRAGAGLGVREGAARPEHPGFRRRLRPVFHPGCRRLHLRRGDRAHRVAGGQEGAAAFQAAVPRPVRGLRPPDHHQQHRDLRVGAVHHAQRRRLVHGAGPAEQRRPEVLSRFPGTSTVPAISKCPSALRSGICWSWRGACATDES